NRYENIRIENSYNGILLAGDVTYPDSGNVITSSGGDTTIIGALGANDIGNNTTDVYGIKLTNQKNVEVSNCMIRDITYTGIHTVDGIYLNNIGTNSTYGTAIIKNNRIFNITRTSSSTTSTAHGIRIDVSPNATATVFNNVVTGLNTGNPAE